MCAKPKLGLSSYSYHLTMGIQGTLTEGVKPDVAWVLDRVSELQLDGLQLEYHELGHDVVSSYLQRTGKYLEIAMATWTREELQERLSACAQLGVKSLRAFLSFDPLVWKRFDADRAGLMKHLEEAATLAEAAGVPLALENHSDYAAWQIAALLKDLRSKWVGICFDSGNPPSSLEDPVDAAKAAAPYVIATHLRDYKVVHADFGICYEGVALGSGDVDVAEVTRILRNESPAVAYSVESAVREDPAISFEEVLRYEQDSVVRSVEFARTTLGF